MCLRVWIELDLSLESALVGNRFADQPAVIGPDSLAAQPFAADQEGEVEAAPVIVEIGYGEFLAAIHIRRDEFTLALLDAQSD